MPGQQRPESLVVLGFRRCQADRAVGAAVEGAEEADDVRAGPVAYRASLMAPSTASAPELVRNTRVVPGHRRTAARPRTSASRSAGRSRWPSSAAGPRPARARPRPPAGGQWPVEFTAIPALKSRNRLPSTSSSAAPLAALRHQRVGARQRRAGHRRVALAALALRRGPGSSVRMSGTGPVGSPATRRAGERRRSLRHHRSGLLAHVLLDVVQAAAGLAGAAGALPATEGLHPGPGTGRGAGRRG